MFTVKNNGHQSVYGYINRNALANGLRARTQVCDDANVPYTKTGFVYKDKKLDIMANSKNFLRIINEKLPEEVSANAEQDLRDAVRPFDPFDVQQEEYLLKKSFCYCPECIKNGYHSVYTRLSGHNECEIHKGMKLTDKCPFCGSKMNNFIDLKADPGYVCSVCGAEISGIKEPELLLKSIYNEDPSIYPKMISKAPGTDIKAVIGNTDRDHVFINYMDVKEFLDNYLESGIRPEPDVSIPKNLRQYENPYLNPHSDASALYSESIYHFRMIPDYTTVRNFYLSFMSAFKRMNITSSMIKNALTWIYYQEYHMLSEIYIRREMPDEEEIVNYVSRLLWPQLEYCFVLIETVDTYDLYVFRYAAIPSEDGLSMEPVVDVLESITSRRTGFHLPGPRLIQ